MAAAFWFSVAVLGQLLFAVYVAGFYGRAAVQGRPEIWNQVLPHGYVAGDTFLNLVLGLHLLFAVVVTVGGTLQLIPQIRRNTPGQGASVGVDGVHARCSSASAASAFVRRAGVVRLGSPGIQRTSSHTRPA